MKNFLSIIFAVVLTMGLCTCAYAASQVIEAEGVFVMGDNDTKTQAKDFALQDAKRIALEKAGTYLQSSTQVVNGQVTRDEIVSIASGVIRVEKIISEETRLANSVISLVVKASFIIDGDDLQKKIDALQKSEKRQDEIQQLAELQKRYDNVIAENNRLKTQLAQTTDVATKEQLLNKTLELDNQLTATQLLEQGNNYYYNKDYDSALFVYNKAIELDPVYVAAYNDRGLAYSEKGQLDLAIADYTKALQLNPQYATAYYNRGNVYCSKEQYDLAIEDYTKSIRLYPQEAMAYNNRGIAYSEKGKYDAAIADFNKAIALNPQSAQIYYNRGISYDEYGKPDLAIADYTKAIALDPKDTLAYYNRGFSYAQKGKYDAAIADFNKVIQLDAQYADAYYLRGFCYEAKGQYGLAVADYTKAVQLNPQDRDFQQALASVQGR